MKNPNGSDIPGARKIIERVATTLPFGSFNRVSLFAALGKMTRQKPIRVADRQQTKPITATQKRQIRFLAGDLSLSNADIAALVGLPKCASGRVTEVLQGLR